MFLQCWNNAMTDEAMKADMDRLLVSFDFAQAIAAAEASHRREYDALLVAYLDVVDSLLRLQHVVDSDPDRVAHGVARSLGVIVRNALNLLRQQGVEPLPCRGQPVDLDTSEVVEVRPDPAHPEDSVIEELQRGFLRHGRLIRRARVVIAGPSGPARSPGGDS
jgi:molecular chaperone GrpE